MTEPWRNGALHSGAIDPLDNPVLQRDSARELAALLKERNEKALRLHVLNLNLFDGLGVHYCKHCGHPFPCPTRRALTGADE